MLAGAQIIQHAHGISARDQGFNDMRTDKSGAAGN